MNKTCQNCQAQFVVDDRDTAYYEKLNVPTPTFCPHCRLIRRMTFRNERTLYKRTCQAPGHSESTFSIFAPQNAQRVYCHAAWWGDGWDPITYGREVDWTKPFLEQVGELWRETPDVAVLNINAVNSDYCSITEGNKNCYLVIGGDFNEECLYSAFIFNSKECMDTYSVTQSELCYELTDCLRCTRVSYSRNAEDCYDSTLLLNCRNCHDCVGCVNLTSKSYCIFNVQYTKEEYAAKLAAMQLDTRAGLQAAREQFASHVLTYPQRAARLISCVDATGDNLQDAKNTKDSFGVFGGAEDSRYLWLAYSSVKDAYDCDHLGQQSERVVDTSTVYPGSNVFFSRFIFNCHDIYYSYNCHGSSYLFGCIGLRNKQYCILNKQYTKEEYEALVPKIIEHMNTMPYVDAKGRTYAFGEFFPSELSPFAYNETVAQELESVSEEEAVARGYRWQVREAAPYTITKQAADLPAKEADVPESITGEVIGCDHAGACNHQCATAFRVTPAELALYRKMHVNVPTRCPNCRHYERLEQRNPLKLWSRTCDCIGNTSKGNAYKNSAAHQHEGACGASFETTYSPDRKEIVYCESCYSAEVA